MLNSRPMSYGQSYDNPRFQSHFKKGNSGLGDVPGGLVETELQPNDPVFQDVYNGTVWGSPGGSYNLPTPADIAAGQTIPFSAQVKDWLPAGTTPTNLLMFGAGALLLVVLLKKL